MPQVFVSDIGTRILGTAKDENGNIVDVSLADTTEMVFVSPDGTRRLSREAGPVDTGADGELIYVTTPADTDLFDVQGRWFMQLVITWATTKLHSEIVGIDAVKNL